MKLGKTLIVTGLLFSSVLGSVNVNNITAMAAGNPQVQATGTVPVTAKYVLLDEDGKEKDVTSDLIKDDSTTNQIFDVKEGETKISLQGIHIPKTYVLVSEGDVTISDDKTVTIKVKKAVFTSVKATYIDSMGNELTNVSAPTEIKIKDTSKPVSAENLEIPAGFQVVNYLNGNVTLQEVYKADVTILFEDENGASLPMENNVVLKDKRVKDTVSEKEVIAPKGFILKANQNVVISPSIDQKGINSYTAKIKVVKNVTNKTNKKPSGHSHGGYTVQIVRISFIDQDGNEAGYKQLNGKDTFSEKIAAPAGYSLVNSSDATIKFDKKGNKDIKINVTKNKPTPVMSEGIVTTNSGEYFHLYTLEGKDITNRGLSGDSKWYTDQYATINGEKMYRVATNEWVKATDVYK